MQARDLLPYVATLGLLALWAITHLFNREDQPLPPRAGRPPNPDGARPQPATGPPRRVEPPMRWSPPPGSNPTNRGPGGRPMRLDDDIVIIEAEPPRRPPAAPARPVGAPAAKRPARGRAPGPAAAKPPEPKATKSLSATLAPLVARPVEFKPLTLPQENLFAQENARKSAAGAPATTSSVASALALDFPSLVKSPERVLQGVILGEILLPPLALRNRRR